MAKPIEKGKYIGRMVNKWRQRMVAVYEHPTDTTKLVTVGRPFDGSAPIECVENRTDWTATLAKMADAEQYGRVYTYE